MPWLSYSAPSIPRPRVKELLDQALLQARQRVCLKPKRVLLLPPDITRMHSGAGWITEHFYKRLKDNADVHVIPTLGQHEPHTREQNAQMFGSIPHERIHPHDWRGGCVQVGEVPADYVKEATGGIADWPFPIWLNRMLLEEHWDLIINIGHVVPHEVLGFANHNKNYFIGLAGKELICASHMAAACCGIENNLASLITPVRQCFNWAEEKFLGHLPDFYVQVTLAHSSPLAPRVDRPPLSGAAAEQSAIKGASEHSRSEFSTLVHTGIFVGDDLETYLAAARAAREQNITVLDEPLKKVVCVMQGDEFFSTWVANKAVYRTRMALADGGELLIIAPGLKRFGEQPDVDALIRKYGYCGTGRVMELYQQNADMQDLAHATAHLIHGSSEGRFTIRYAPGHLTKADIEQVKYEYADLSDTLRRYVIDQLEPGFNDVSGERIYFIPTPSAGLWATREKLYGRRGGFGAA
ncbi:MAG TPA: lactate racemase domain-containing protein [Pirellulaceae bacterium]|nr:lactate racemase domain-containing protein [Pirellulaceae bacterium]